MLDEQQAFFFISKISSQKFKLCLSSLIERSVVLALDSRSERHLSLVYSRTLQYILEIEEARLSRLCSIASSLSSFDSLARIRSTFSAKPSAILNASRILSSEVELSLFFLSSCELTESAEDPEVLVFLLTVDISLSIGNEEIFWRNVC